MTTTKDRSSSRTSSEQDMSAPARPNLNVESGFSDFDPAPEFQPIKQHARSQPDPFEVALTGPAYFRSSAPATAKARRKLNHPDSEPVKDEQPTAPKKRRKVEELSMPEAPEPSTARKLTMVAAAIASVVAFIFLGIQNFPSATAHQTTYEAPATITSAPNSSPSSTAGSPQ